MYWIVTDSTIDMPKEWIDRQEGLAVKAFSYVVDGVSHTPDGSDEDAKQIYAELRAGKVLTTTQINSEEWSDTFREIFLKGEDLICIPLSGGLSGTVNAAISAAESLKEEYPQRKAVVIDSFAASAGQGLLVQYALWNREKGMSLEENAAWVEENRHHINHWFTVDDLMFLKRGGRVSAAAAYLGSLIRIKPVLDVDMEGHLIPREKVQGRKRSIRALAQRTIESIEHPEEQEIFISHGDCLEDAEALAEIIRQELPVKNVRISYIGPIVGAHAGPGTVAIFCLGKQKV